MGGREGVLHARLGSDFGWVGWGRYGLLRYMAGIGGMLICLLVAALFRGKCCGEVPF
jgi:hypothetical protein